MRSYEECIQTAPYSTPLLGNSAHDPDPIASVANQQSAVIGRPLYIVGLQSLPLLYQ